MTNPNLSENSWFAWSKHVLMQLERDSLCLDQIKREQIKIREEIAALKVKSGIWGLVGGAIPVVLGLAVYFIKSML